MVVWRAPRNFVSLAIYLPTAGNADMTLAARMRPTIRSTMLARLPKWKIATIIEMTPMIAWNPPAAWPISPGTCLTPG